jgi:hypothetical protein
VEIATFSSTAQLLFRSLRPCHLSFLYLVMLRNFDAQAWALPSIDNAVA